MTVQKGERPALAAQVLSTLESLIDAMAEKAVARHAPPAPPVRLWLTAQEASDLLGAGYPPARVKQLGNAGEIVSDRLDPTKGNSPYIFERQSVLNYSSRRVFQLDQKGNA